VSRAVCLCCSFSVDERCLLWFSLVARSGLSVVMATTRGSGFGAVKVRGLPALLVSPGPGREGKDGYSSTERFGTAG